MAYEMENNRAWRHSQGRMNCTAESTSDRGDAIVKHGIGISNIVQGERMIITVVNLLKGLLMGVSFNWMSHIEYWFVT